MTSYWTFGNSEYGEWTSYQMRKVAGCACAGNAGNVFPPPRVSDPGIHPGIHRGTCVTHVLLYMPGSLTIGYLWSRLREKTFLAFPAQAQPAIFRIRQEVHACCHLSPYFLITNIKPKLTPFETLWVSCGLNWLHDKSACENFILMVPCS